MKAITTYDKNNIREQELVNAEIHCPECGDKNVWVETCEGDYYLGPTNYCISCGHKFSYSSYGKDNRVKIISK
jgi:DNA-directed RNA polymerase subunit RPC12/RpoP